MDDLILKQFDKPDEVRNFEKGKFENIEIFIGDISFVFVQFNFL